MTDLYTATVRVPVFLDPRWDLAAALREGGRQLELRAGDCLMAKDENRVERDVDGWPLRVFTVKITREEDV